MKYCGDAIEKTGGTITKGKEKFLQIGNYPPPMCGWAIQTKLVAEELRRRGHICKVLKINENRTQKNPAYIDVQGGVDYLWKIMTYALGGYRINVHVNGQSRKGYALALAAVLVARMVNRPALLTFHGGLPQRFFPLADSAWLRRAFKFLFRLAGAIACDSLEIKQAIEDYGIEPCRVTAIATFSAQYVNFAPVPLAPETEIFLADHHPVFFSYVSLRSEYRLEVLCRAQTLFRQSHPRAGFVWVGFPCKELPLAQEFVREFPIEDRQNLLVVGNLAHDEFLTLLTRSYACLRTPACDGVSASVLESLALGIPVIASENGRRPSSVITYSENDPADMCSKLVYVTQRYAEVKGGIQRESGEDNVGRMVDWLTGKSLPRPKSGFVHVG